MLLTAVALFALFVSGLNLTYVGWKVKEHASPKPGIHSQFALFII